jgi:hypothetical protein
MSRPISFAILIALLAVTLAIPASAQGQRPGPPTPDSPPDGSVAWPSGDELRRELQDIGFTFRVERDNGDWLGWAPRASIVEAPAVTLGGAGSEDAGVRLSFELLQTDLLGADVDAALTALMEVAARLPLAPARADRMRRFVVDDLLVKAPLALEPCYASIAEEGAVLIAIDQETGAATIELASSPSRLDIDAEFDLDACAPIAPSTDGPAPGEPTSERITIVAAGEPAMFDPIETVVEGSLVTLVLTFRNETSDDQSLTFETATRSGTDIVAPGEVKLIVVLRLPPGEYAIYSETDPEAIRGIIRIVEPATE